MDTNRVRIQLNKVDQLQKLMQKFREEGRHIRVCLEDDNVPGPVQMLDLEPSKLLEVQELVFDYYEEELRKAQRELHDLTAVAR